MKSKTVLLVVALILFLCAIAANAQNDSEAAKCYVAGEQAWNAGNLDEAISQWQQALKLKPTSSLTKDRLIEALQKKIAILTQQLAEAQAQSGKPKEIIIRTATPPNATVVPVDTKLLPPDQYTPEVIDRIWTSKEMTSAQREAYWNSLKGYKVQWPAVIRDVKGSGVGNYEVSMQCGPCSVKASMKLSDREAVSLSAGRKCTVIGTLEDHKNGYYYLSNAILM